MKSKASILREVKLTVNMIFELQKFNYTPNDERHPFVEKKIAEMHQHLNTLLWVLEMSPEDVGI